MTITGAHAGPISGKTHLHLLRESATARSDRSAPPPPVEHGELVAAAAGDPDFDIAAASGPHGEKSDDVAGEAVSIRRRDQ
jgi:hypothetical protein